MAVPDERRGQPRFHPRHRVAVEFPDQQAQVRDLNLWGAYVLDPRPFPAGRVYRLRLRLDARVTVEAKAMVRRCDPGVGMAMEFIEMTDDDRDRLQDFISLQEGAARATRAEPV